MKQRKIKPEQVERYFNFLRAVHDALSKSKEVQTSDLMSRHNVSRSSLSVMSRHGIVKKMGRVGHVISYKWNTSEPTVQMAYKLVEEVRQHSRNVKQQRKESRQKMPELELTFESQKNKQQANEQSLPHEVITHPEPKETPQTEISFLWGLFKFTKS